MLEMTVTTKIVIGAAVVLLLGAYLYMRQHARDLANKYKKIQRQKFKSKEPVIIEEIIAQLNGATGQRSKGREQRLEPSFAGNNIGISHTQDGKAPLEPTTISTPLRIKEAKYGEKQNSSFKNQGPINKTPINQTIQGSQNLQNQHQNLSQTPVLPQTSIIAKPEQKSLSERLRQETNLEVKQPIKPPPPNPSAKSKIQEIEFRDLDLPKFVKEEHADQNNQLVSEAKAVFPVRGQIKATSIAEELVFQEGETFYTHINDYAKWVASQSNYFTLEYYENDTLMEVVPLIFNSEDLSRLNGHWFQMFRPIDLEELFSGIDKKQSTLYCSFSKKDVEHLCKPALQIFAYVEFEASSRYEQVLEECALKEFVTFLQELKTLAEEDE